MDPEASTHRATRHVHLPAAWENTPADVQVNYYNYIAKRLIYSTDVYIGERLVYRTNAIACRGDDLLPGQPTALVVGDDFVHGDLSGSFVDEIVLGPCRALNGGIENLPLSHAVDRFNELVAATAPVAGVFAAPRRELIPEPNRVTKRHEGEWEPQWAAQLDRLQRPPVFALMQRGPQALRIEGEEDEPILERFDRFVEDWARRQEVPLLVPGQAQGGLAGLARKLGLGPKGRPGQHPAAALIEARLTKPVLAYLRSNPPPKVEPPALVQPDAQSAHGPEDVGRVYPLW